MEIIAFFGAVLMGALWNAIYVGFHIISNDKNFEKSIIYKKIQLVTIYLQRFVVDHVLSVKKLVFSKIKV
jgi:hypothetical protein